MSAQKGRNKQLDLLGRVAVVTGASRGAGRAIAAVLGEHRATVWVSGRSVRGQPTTDGLPGTIDDAAEEVTRRGGTGISARCDHANEHDVEALFKRVREEQGRLDILVNNAWGGYLPSIRSCVCFGGWRKSCANTVSQRWPWLPGSCAPSV